MATTRRELLGAGASAALGLFPWSNTTPVFAQPSPAAGTATSQAWDDGDLAIDAFHLKKLADEQKPFGANDVRVWQEKTGLSNNEAAALIGVSLSTWNGYKAGSPIPKPVAMLCRAITRDPIMMQAHLRPRVAGRPRSKAS